MLSRLVSLPESVPRVEEERRSKIGELHPRRFFLETWRRMDEEAAAERAERAAAGLGYDWRPLVVLSTGAVFLILMEYLGMPGAFIRLSEMLEERDIGWLTDLRFSTYGELCQHAWWALWRVLGFFLLPVAVVKLSGQRLRDQGLSLSGFTEHLWIYALFFGIVLGCVVVVSYTEDFATYYPFYARSSRSWVDFVAWELLYAAQFFSLEFFFRGWWLKGMKAVMGSHAIYAMVVPYVMIHFGKPWAETFAAIVAGVVLGTLAMKTRSIWSGFLIHVSVAVSMDVAALLQTTGLPERLLPPG
jgi:membrane protease YdiL (CAAX protease family)